jgi:AraC-like DNA-binding protein
MIEAGWLRVEGQLVGIDEIRRLITVHARRKDLGLPGVRILKVTDPDEPTPSIAEPILAFSMQGAKRIALVDRVFDQTPGTFMTVAVDLPITGQFTQASRAEPYLGFALELRPASIASLMVDAASSLPHAIQEPPPPGISINAASPEMLDAIARLLALIEHPADAPVLAPLLEREILWRVLSGPAGNAVRQIGLQDSSLTYIGRAIRHLRSNAFEPIQVPELARLSGMGVSSFHKQFRTVTAMSPIQYQKRIRLQEARLRLIHDPHDVAAVGHAVGYSSASQFSREYRREFGAPPSEDAARMRAPDQATA